MNYQSTSSYLFANGLRLHYLKWANPAAEHPIILLHGLASNAHIWELTALRLAQARLWPLAWDGRGHGLSDAPDGDYGFDTYLSDLARFIEMTGVERPLLVGHSWGAMLALDYAARSSLGPYAPSGIVLVDGGMSQLSDNGLSWEQTRERLTPPRLAGMPLAEFLPRLQTHTTLRLSKRVRDIILGNFSIAEDDTIHPHLSFEHHMQIVQALWEFPTYERYRQLRCPALLLPAVPASAHSRAEQEHLAYKRHGVQKALQSSPKTQVLWLKNTIHDVPLQRPGKLARLIIGFAQGLT